MANGEPFALEPSFDLRSKAFAQVFAVTICRVRERKPEWNGNPRLLGIEGWKAGAKEAFRTEPAIAEVSTPDGVALEIRSFGPAIVAGFTEFSVSVKRDTPGVRELLREIESALHDSGWTDRWMEFGFELPLAQALAGWLSSHPGPLPAMELRCLLLQQVPALTFADLSEIDAFSELLADYVTELVAIRTPRAHIASVKFNAGPLYRVSLAKRSYGGCFAVDCEHQGVTAGPGIIAVASTDATDPQNVGGAPDFMRPIAYENPLEFTPIIGAGPLATSVDLQEHSTTLRVRLNRPPSITYRNDLLLAVERAWDLTSPATARAGILSAAVVVLRELLDHAAWDSCGPTAGELQRAVLGSISWDGAEQEAAKAVFAEALKSALQSVRSAAFPAVDVLLVKLLDGPAYCVTMEAETCRGTMVVTKLSGSYDHTLTGLAATLTRRSLPPVG